MPLQRSPLLTTLLAVTAAVGLAFAQGDTMAQPLSGLTKALQAGVGDLLDATRNKEFLSRPLTAEQVEQLRAHLGRDVATRALGSGELAGRTIKELMSSRPEIAKEFPQVISYLAATQRQQGVRVYGNDRDPAPLDLTQPGRVIPNDDLSRIASGSEQGERVGEYLKSNFQMDDAQMRAYSAFMDLAAGRNASVLAGGRPTDTAPVYSALSTAVKSMPSGSKGGMYLPGGEVLGRVSQLIAYLDAYRQEPNADASRFRGPDGRTLADLIAEFDPDSGRQRSVDQLRRLNEAEVQSTVSDLMSKVVKTDLEGSNRFLFEMGLAWVKPAETAAATGGDASGKRAPRGAMLGNGNVRRLNDELYRKLILEKHTGPERDKIELESDGEFFAVRGRPKDITQKHYDPPIDGDNMYFGAGMNLDHRPKPNP